MKNFISFIAFVLLFFAPNFVLGCSEHHAKKELYDTKEQAEKEAIKSGCEGAHKMGNQWIPCNRN
ncbi:DUF3721 domain-containing protein [Prochlorococcus sp. MIT 0604]|uniref:DUF3721 domain-containing protein n=1 Tax=Prochlorococcus sp. MIT 0604 TaxID=1501268 RepID=UPI0004F8ED0E|nr:DUF3721 domain-containing protein [Prochlorococcus sp. MIT 0604]AIQ95537.1 hypothetical protein EW14_1526 [Prochlorococcus sp. MIT 0604]